MGTIVVLKWSIHPRIHYRHPACSVLSFFQVVQVSSMHKFGSKKEHGRRLCKHGEHGVSTDGGDSRADDGASTEESCGGQDSSVAAEQELYKELIPL